jgi:hypothetical protein
VPILELWAPLLRSLSQWRGRDDAQWAQFFNAVGPPRKPQTPEPVRLPDRYVWSEPTLCCCQSCGCEFYRVGGSGRYCSDLCAEASWRASRAVRAKAARAAGRADSRCAHCNEPITAQRSDSKFCSMRCRVAAHRAHLKASQGSKQAALLATGARTVSGRLTLNGYANGHVLEPAPLEGPEPVQFHDQRALGAARMWIRRTLADGPKPEADVARRLAEMGLAHLLQPAADALGVRCRQGQWWLPG